MLDDDSNLIRGPDFDRRSSGCRKCLLPSRRDKGLLQSYTDMISSQTIFTRPVLAASVALTNLFAASSEKNDPSARLPPWSGPSDHLVFSTVCISEGVAFANVRRKGMSDTAEGVRRATLILGQVDQSYAASAMVGDLLEEAAVQSDRSSP